MTKKEWITYRWLHVITLLHIVSMQHVNSCKNSYIFLAITIYKNNEILRGWWFHVINLKYYTWYYWIVSTTAQTVILQQVQWDEWQVGKCKNVIQILKR